MGRDEGDQRTPGHHQFHLIQEFAFARALGLHLEAAAAQTHLFHLSTVSHPA